MTKLLMIDNYDSFTYNLVQYFTELGVVVSVVRNDEMSVADLLALSPQRVVLSPGPCTPDEAGVSVPLIQQLAGRLPVLGVCLGHQCIGRALGGAVVRAGAVMHGKTSAIHHLGSDLFCGLPSPFSATRYHSLVVAEADLPQDLQVTAWAYDEGSSRREIMGLRHTRWPLFGVQFHPESILSEHGHLLLRNFLVL